MYKFAILFYSILQLFPELFYGGVAKSRNWFILFFPKQQTFLVPGLMPWIGESLTPAFQLGGQVSVTNSITIINRRRSSINVVHLPASAEGAVCFWFPVAVLEALHCRATSRSSIKMTFIDCAISLRPEKKLSIVVIHWRRLVADPVWPPRIQGKVLKKKLAHNAWVP